MKYSDLELVFNIQRTLLDVNSIRHKDGLGKHGKRVEAAFMHLPRDIREELAEVMLVVIKSHAVGLGLLFDKPIEGFGPHDAWDLNG